MIDMLNAMEEMGRRKAEERCKEMPVPGRIRASEIGYDVRRIVARLRPDLFPRTPMAPRALRTFDRGDEVHERNRLYIRRVLEKLGLDASGIPVRKDDEAEYAVDVCEVDGQMWRVVGHPDGVLPGAIVGDRRLDEKVLLEVKSAASYGWDKVLEGQPNQNYLAQATVYMHMTGTRWCLFLYERKDTQHLHQFLYPYRGEYFDELMDRARDVAEAATSITSVDELDICDGDDYGEGRDKSGPRLNWGCSYCQFTRVCHPNHVAIFTGGKVRWIPAELVKDGALVVDWGKEVAFKEGNWKRISED